ncbi:MAG: AEC family transporter [Peptostreptococcaceae bacterium]|nr:AEC family transporter [Peptostreptococcaceae bacterium]
MGFFLIFSKVFVIFLLIFVGYALARSGLVTEKGQKEMTNALLYAFLPCALIRAFQVPFEKQVFFNGVLIFILMGIAYVLTTIASVFIAKFVTKDKAKQAILVLGMVLPNVGFMGYPLIESLIGKEYIFYAVMANISFEIISWSIMVSIITKSMGTSSDMSVIKRLSTMPPIIAIGVGLITYFLPFMIPDPFMSTINLLGNAMTPVAMLIVGMSLSKADLKKVLFQKELYIVSFVRLVVYPAALLMIFKWIGISGVLYSIPIILISMPSAGYTNIIAGKFGADATFASEIVTLCNLISLITIPVILSFM